jgi:NCS2 family nucleobase:cation symporter-2
MAAKAGGLPLVAGMTISAGLVEIVLAHFLQRLRLIIQPTISGLTICIIALELGIVGLQQALDVARSGAGSPAAHVAAAALTFAVCVGFTVWGKGVLRLICSLLGMICGVAGAFALGLFGSDALASLAAAPWIALPDPGYISLRWDPHLLPAFLAAGLAATIRTVGVITTCQKANDAAWKRPSFVNLRRGVLADGLGCTIGGIVGAPGMNVGPSLVGISIATGVTSRTIAYGCAAVLAVMAFLPKVADIFLQLPVAVAGALLLFTASIMLVSGLQLMTARALDTRLTFVVGLGLLFPLTRIASPGYFDGLPAWLSFLTDSSLALGLAAAIGLLFIFRIATGRQQTILWRQSADAVADLAAALERNAAGWGLTADVVERGLANTRQTIELLKEGGLMHEPVSIRAAERDNSLEIELRYQGMPLAVPDLATRTELNEETAMAAGLRDVALGVYPDRSSTSSHGAAITIRLSFDM